MLSDVRLYGGTHDALKIEQIKVSPTYVGTDRIDLGKIQISNIVAEAQRSERSQLGFGPIELAGTQPLPATRPTTRAIAAAPSTQPMGIPNLSLDELEIRNVQFGFSDQAIAGTPRLSLVLDRVTFANLATKARGPSTRPVTIEAQLRAPGLAHPAGFATRQGNLKLGITAGGNKYLKRHYG